MPRRSQLLEHSRPQRGAFEWVGPRAQLIDQYQRQWGRTGEDLAQILDVCTECREARLDRLFVAHVGEDLIEDGDPASSTNGRGHATLHQGRARATALSRQSLPPVLGPLTSSVRSLGWTRLRSNGTTSKPLRDEERDDDHGRMDEALDAVTRLGVTHPEKSSANLARAMTA